ncbi:putative MFS transporter [Aspergillus brunneoviolaceus CBS 621.78]|uniref:MFS general substrate transporter n=1 Tax=Aspergillus brunneoviolaceus CBS 621.78 TaxID=1450534 RepID=A0ACD1G8F1_9EURO|nr:MFS general substrate transporter [Aspergillus brunneoviolaceus CBS 621.78]RAH45555.1 MFS general substrate transporter [Aspergillus brunneoviolaceus CBS 621.78]
MARMASRRTPIFTANRLQICTYLFGVCPFSIAFLVFLNSSVSFVVTELLGLDAGEGDAVGTLGFADELLALIACPLWGVLSDRIGVRNVCVTGYGIIAIALLVFVQAKNVYPQLLLGRLLFSLGGAAVSTMVTAVLPAVVGSPSQSQPTALSRVAEKTPSSKLAGYVGMCAGSGALVALVVFLPLPSRLQQRGVSPPQSIQYSYYVVAIVSLSVAVLCSVGLRHLPGEEGKAWSSLWARGRRERPEDTCASDDRNTDYSKRHLPYFQQLGAALMLGFHNSDIFLGYVGGFVARASSVGISLFIPLAVNHYYRQSDLCQGNNGDGMGSDAVKQSCRKAYVLASILTGVSQLIALVAAPIFGYMSERSRQYPMPLLGACVAGVVGYITFAVLPSPDFREPHGSPGVFVVMALLGLSQIGAIVCSLSVLSTGILLMGSQCRVGDGYGSSPSTLYGEETDDDLVSADETEGDQEEQALLTSATERNQKPLAHLKGSIAGVYSLYGGAGILVLTKVGGLLFDVLSSGAPFYILASFNGFLILAGIACGVVKHSKTR